MATITTRVGPSDDGRRMSLDEFEEAEGVEGHLYELGRGVIAVMQVPRTVHALRVQAVRNTFTIYQLAHPERVVLVAGGAECRIVAADLESERHPGVAIYMTPAPSDNPWAQWVPDIVVEGVSPGSEHRDYQEKPEEYLRFGVREYWIVDAKRQETLVLTRSKGKWAEKVLRPGEVHRTSLLPGFEFDCRTVFAVGSSES